MKGNQKVLDTIIALLPTEYTAQVQYQAHAQLYRAWGYLKLKHKLHHFFYEEHTHAKQLLNRLLLLGGSLSPELFASEPVIGNDLSAMMHNDLDGENEAIQAYNDAVAVAEEAGDNTTAKLLRKILKDQEDHAQWLETQLHLIGELGKAGYLSEQLDE